MAGLLSICKHSLLVHDEGEERPEVLPLLQDITRECGQLHLSFEGGEYEELVVVGTYNQI